MVDESLVVAPRGIRPSSPCTVIVLGAGFSRAVNSEFPTTDALGELVRRRLPAEDARRLPQAKFKDGRFEEWLSYLAERQPHHDEAWALEANALEIRITKEIHAVLADIHERRCSVTSPVGSSSSYAYCTSTRRQSSP